jgi:hypothetical protein
LIGVVSFIQDQSLAPVREHLVAQLKGNSSFQLWGEIIFPLFFWIVK